MIVFGFDSWSDFINTLFAQADRIGARNRWFVQGVSPAIGYGLWGWLLFALTATYLLSRNVNPFTRCNCGAADLRTKMERDPTQPSSSGEALLSVRSEPSSAAAIAALISPSVVPGGQCSIEK